MSDALSEMAKDERKRQEYNSTILLLAKRVNNQTKHVKDREEWEAETSDLVEAITEDIFEELEVMWIENGGSPP